MQLHEKIKNQLNLADCLISAYYNEVKVSYYNEDGSSMVLKESISDLVNGRNNFSIDVSDMNVTVEKEEYMLKLAPKSYKPINVLCVHIRPRTDVFLVCWHDTIEKCRPFDNIFDAMKFAEKLDKKYRGEECATVLKDCQEVGSPVFWGEHFKYTDFGKKVLLEEIEKLRNTVRGGINV